METYPSDAATAPKEVAVECKPPVAAGYATKYYLVLKPYPSTTPRRLWLLVDGAWRYLDNPDAETQDSVQEAFCNCPDKLQVAVWYSGVTIEGLVVLSK